MTKVTAGRGGRFRYGPIEIPRKPAQSMAQAEAEVRVLGSLT